MEAGLNDLLGQRIGNIRVVSLIGMGGMGAVYEGFDTALQRKVALKVIRGEFRLDPDARARFQREARILSQLDHPGICRVLDYVESGTDDVLVLELIKGRSLRAALNDGLSHADKLRIARQLVQVLAVVHKMGVIHRDLKPENIMVTASGEIKVLDFGLARSVRASTLHSSRPTMVVDKAESALGSTPGLCPAETEALVAKTRCGAVMGTIGYMSPEQARGMPASAASDMYSAGLILQEIFTGKPPFDPTAGGEHLLEMAARAETLPVAGIAPDLAALINRLKSFAQGARPSSVDALEQLDHIIDQPRRQRLRVVVASIWAVLLTLVIGLAVQSMRATRAAERAEKEAERAERQSRAADEVTDYLIDIFQVSEPDKARGSSITARELLDRSRRTIGERLASQPLLQARLTAVIGKVYFELGLYTDAKPLLEQALATQESHEEVDPRDVVTTLMWLGQIKNTGAAYEQAEGHFAKAIALVRERIGVNDQLYVVALEGLADAQRNLGRYAESERNYLHCLEILSGGPQTRDQNLSIASIQNNLSHQYTLQARYNEAEKLARTALATRQGYPDLDPLDVAWSLNVLGWLLVELGHYEEADEALSKALEVRLASLGADHPYVGTTLNNLGGLRRRQGRLTEADDFFLRAIAVLKKKYDPSHPYIAKCQASLGFAVYLEGRVDEARSLLEGALRVQEGSFGPDDPKLAETLKQLAMVYASQGRVQDARGLFARAQNNISKGTDLVHPELGRILAATGAFLLDQGEIDEAEASFQRALEIAELTLNPDHPDVATALMGIAKVATTKGQSARAREAVLRAHRIRALAGLPGD